MASSPSRNQRRALRRQKILLPPTPLLYRVCGEGKKMAELHFENRDGSALTKAQRSHIARCMKAGRVLPVE